MAKKEKKAYSTESLFRKRLRKFRSIKRGYYSFIIIVSFYILSFFTPLLLNDKPLLVKYNGEYFSPILNRYPAATFGLDSELDVNYRKLKKLFKREDQGNWVLMPFQEYGPNESLTDTDPYLRIDDIKDSFTLVSRLRTPKDPLAIYVVGQISPELKQDIAEAPEFLNPPRRLVKKVVRELNGVLGGGSLIEKGIFENKDISFSTQDLSEQELYGQNIVLQNRFLMCDQWVGSIVKNRQPPTPPSRDHWFGTDDRGRDVFVRICYGFNISLSFSLIIVAISYIIGVSIGASLGYFGGKYDILMQRFIEIWSSIPFLYTIIVISSILQPNFILLVGLLSMFGWVGMTYFIRGEFYREKAKDYVHAAIAMGASNAKVIFKHILPNSLTPVIALGPFAIVGGIFSLLSLDYLGFGLPPPTPSWGELIGQGMSNIFSYWLVLFPMAALFVTLLMVVFIGEAIREAFDPREYSRLR